MTDPVAEAAAKLTADAAPSSTEPSLLERAMDTIHDLEAKVEHLIHPETPPNVDAGTAQPASSGSDTSAQTVSETVAEAPNALPASTSGTLPESTPSATTGSVVSSGSAEAGNVLAVETASSPEQSSAPSAPTLLETSTPEPSLSSIGTSADIPAGTPEIGGAEIPNAAPAAVAQPVIAASAPVASTPAGIPGIVASSVAEPATLAPAATSAIKAGIANIKNHLSIRGFEQSAVADIHAELEAIEKWL